MSSHKNDLTVCNMCENELELCLCICPYCGKTNDCDCSREDISEKNNLEMKINKYSQDAPIKEPAKLQDSVKARDNHHDDDRWRLEKWQIGRRNFP